MIGHIFYNDKNDKNECINGMLSTRAKLTWHDADTWQSHASPRGPTWMPTWRDDVIRLSVWAHGYSGPNKEDRGEY